MSDRKINTPAVHAPINPVRCTACARLQFRIGIGLDKYGLYVTCGTCGHKDRPEGGLIWVAAP